VALTDTHPPASAIDSLVLASQLAADPIVPADLRAAIGLALDRARDLEDRRRDLERAERDVDGDVDALRRSRQRIQAASDALCGRFERSLHDDAQQPLVAVQLILAQVGRARTERQRSELLDAAADHLRTVLHELRQLALVVPPPVLRERGLAAALTSLAERTALPIEVTVDVSRRPAPTVEWAAYLVAAEGVAGAERRSGATYVAIDVRATGSRLTMTVADDAEPEEAGPSLGPLQDRADVLDGHLAVRYPSAGGTILLLDVPLIPTR
jgi:signal transduction histidine kinase